MTPPAEPVVAVLLFGSLAAVLAAAGALPYAGGRRPAAAWVGGAYAVASGLMLGAGHLLMSHGLETAGATLVAGAGAGVLYSHGIQRYSGTQGLDHSPGGELAAGFGYKVILENTLHSASEGVAIGVAMVLDLRLGIFMALALAVHNVGEAMALTDVLTRRGMNAREAAGLCVATNVTQPLLALAVFALSPLLAGLLPAALGFAAGSLVFLVLTELLPGSYKRAAHGLVALLVSVAAGTVLLLEDVFL